MIFDGTTIYKFRVEFDDIDAGGVVHHPKYLMFLERARSSAMREHGYSFAQCLREGLAFVVGEAQLKYLAPAKYEQELFVLSRIVAARRSSLKILQSIITICPNAENLKKAGDDLFGLEGTLFTAQLRLVCVDATSLRPIELPPALKTSFKIPDAEFFIKNPARQKTALGS